jgi:hypothetical protein
MVFLNLELRLYGLKRISGKQGGRIGYLPSFSAKMETKKWFPAAACLFYTILLFPAQ